MKVFLLGSLILGFATMSLATSFDFANKGSIGAGTATLTGSAAAGANLTLTSPLTSANSMSAMGTVMISTGTLTATSNPDVLDFTNGSVTVVNGGSTLFHGTFSGTVTLLGTSTFSISGKPGNGGIVLTELDKHGDVDGNLSVVTPEPGTLPLLGTGAGLIGIAALVRRKKRTVSAATQSPEELSVDPWEMRPRPIL